MIIAKGRFVIPMLHRYLFILGAVLIGSIPFSLVTAYLIKRVDIRRHHDGNPGALNALRTAGFAAGALGVIFDFSKGIFVVYYSRYHWTIESPITWIAALGAIAGHMYSIYLRGRGGKGLAVTYGVLSGLSHGFAAMLMGGVSFLLKSLNFSPPMVVLPAILVVNIVYWFVYPFWLSRIGLGLIALLLFTRYSRELFSRERTS